MTTTYTMESPTTPFQPTSPLRLGLVLALALVTVNCGLCERVDDTNKNAASFAERIPAEADIALFAPDWKAVRNASSILDGKVKGLPFSLSSVLSEVESATGLSVSDPVALAKQGILAERGFAVVVIEEQTVAMFAIDKPKSFESTITQAAKTRWQAAELPVEKKIQIADRTFTMKALVRKQAQKDGQGNVPLTAQNTVFAWALIDGIAVVVPNPEMSDNTKDPEIVLRSYLNTSDPKTAPLSKQADYQKLEPWMTKDSQLFAIANLSKLLQRGATNSRNPENTARLNTLASSMKTLGVKLNVTQENTALRFKSIASPEMLPKLQKAFASKSSISDWTVAFDQNAQVVLKLNLDPQEGIPEFATWLTGSDTTDDAISKRLNLDIRNGLLPSLDGNIVLAFADLDQRTLAGAMRGSIQALFRKGHITATFGVKDRTKLLATIDPLQQSTFGMLQRRDEGALAIYTVGPPNLTGDPQKQAKPFVTMVVADKHMTVFSGAVPQERGMQIAALKGTGSKGRLHANDNAKRLLTTANHSGLTLDLGSVGAQLSQNNQGPAIGPAAILSSMNVLTLDVHVGDTGPLVDVVLDFADPNAPKPTVQPTTTPTPAPNTNAPPKTDTPPTDAPNTKPTTP